MVKIYLLLLFNLKIIVALLCYNCSSTNRDWNGCEGDFVQSVLVFNNTRNYLVNCTKENSMCFVRSWSARAQRTWIVQRGCYEPSIDDPLTSSMTSPTRAMTCKHERLAEAEYKVCLCKADWCNSSSYNISHHIVFIMIIILTFQFFYIYECI